MAYRADVEHIEKCTPALIERNAAEFGRMRELLESVEPAVKKARGTQWESEAREGFDQRLTQVAGLVTHLAEGFQLARNALLRYADAVELAQSQLKDGITAEEELDRLVSSVAKAITPTAQAAEPMRRWEDIRATTGFWDWVAEIGVDADSIREDANRVHGDADAAFGRALKTEEDARRECVAKLAAAHAALPDFRGGDFADGEDLKGWVTSLLDEETQAKNDPNVHLKGDDPDKDPFSGAGDAKVSPALQEIRNRLKSLPEGESLWLMDELDREQWIRDNKELITAAAEENGLPPDLLAGIALKEVGGKPYIFDNITETARELAEGDLSPITPENLPGPLGGDRDNTSYGPMAVQIRRAAEVLGYDPEHLSEEQRDEIRGALQDPAQNLFISAKYLADLKAESSAVDVPPEQMTPEQYKEMASRYNGGPYWQNNQAQAYGQDFEANLDKARRALQ
ncbi:hypothetical protein [Streptomyces sp. HB2AG]|uniref:hypothetical protein n=1 Tax=Streptomyces sp. HB2AG TaxID=2983400 RepID=UPI0022AAD1ED|nr:hypothetical protein [Streptomyces sp. HB2AG]MCZ2524847.1 hypothetical protein [Streptomyces sp. HB2AG]